MTKEQILEKLEEDTTYKTLVAKLSVDAKNSIVEETLRKLGSSEDIDKIIGYINYVLFINVLCTKFQEKFASQVFTRGDKSYKFLRYNSRPDNSSISFNFIDTDPEMKRQNAFIILDYYSCVAFSEMPDLVGSDSNNFPDMKLRYPAAVWFDYSDLGGKEEPAPQRTVANWGIIENKDMTDLRIKFLKEIILDTLFNRI